MSYFEIKVQSGSKSELDKRVADNRKRGFEVARYYEYETEGRCLENSKYKDSDGVMHRYRVHEASKIYGAVMRKCNLAHLKQKQLQN